jgi:chemotaxis protein methyltransferase CheR
MNTVQANNPFTNAVAISADEFKWMQQYLYRNTGIVLSDSKQSLVSGRLDKRLRFYGFNSYTEYFHLLGKPGHEQETVMAIDLLTTNETYFFREHQHFNFLKDQVFKRYAPGKSLRIWSAASSSGEEAYSLAMLLAEHAPTQQWEVLGTDISERILEKARSGLYPLQAAEKIPKPLLKKYCLKGGGEYDGFLLIDQALRKRVRFLHLNLNESWQDIGRFDVIFLRNVMIYFDTPTKQRLIDRMPRYLHPGGFLIISHAESLTNLRTELKMFAPSIYQKSLHV